MKTKKRMQLLLGLGTTVLSSLTSSVRAEHSPAAPPLEPAFIGDFPLDPDNYFEIAQKDKLRIDNVPLKADTRVDLVLERFEIAAPGAICIVVDDDRIEQQVPLPEISAYEGYVRGRPDSSVFLTVGPGELFGWIQFPETQYYISAGMYGSGLAPVVFDAADEARRIPQGPVLTCGVRGTQVVSEPARGGPAPGPQPGRCFQVAIDSDAEFRDLLAFNSDTSCLRYIARLVASTSKIYRDGFNANVMYSYIRIWSGSVDSDPWGAQTNDHAQLQEFRDYWSEYMGAIRRHSAALFMGRALGGSGGLGEVGALCDNNDSYAIVISMDGITPYPLISPHPSNKDIYEFAHELGHNFGSMHTNCYNPPIDKCAGDSDTYNENGWDCHHERVCEDGTIMSYCHLCAGLYLRIRLQMHSRNIFEGIVPYISALDSNSTCEPATLCDGTVWVDYTHNTAYGEEGTFPLPFNTFDEGLTKVPSGQTLAIKGGSSGSLQRRITKAMTIKAYGNPTRIGG